MKNARISIVETQVINELDRMSYSLWCVSGVQCIEQRDLCNLTNTSGLYIRINTDATSCDYLIFISLTFIHGYGTFQ
jgi:hypothetical protein